MGAVSPEPAAPVEKKRSRAALRIGIAVGVAIALYGGLVFAVGREIPVGTVVNGVEIGRMTKAQAKETLEAYSKTFAKSQVALTAHGEITQDSAANLGLSIDVDATITTIKTQILNPIELLTAFFGGQEIPGVILVDGALDGALSDIAASVDEPAVDAGVSFKYGVAKTTPSKVGLVLDLENSRAMIIEAATQNTFDIKKPLELPMVDQTPDISDAEVEALITDELPLAISAPVTINAQAGSTQTAASTTFSVTDLEAAIRFRKVAGELTLTLNANEIKKRTDPGFVAVGIPVQDATWDTSSGTPVIVASEPGFGITDASMIESIKSVWLLPEGQRSTTVTFGLIEPSFTTAEAQEMGVVELVSTYTQSFPAAAYRSTNIGQAAAYMDGTLIKPGEVYSMNKTILERTFENGYTNGWIIAGGGIFKMEAGGGVSTATTATFNAAWLAGVDFVEWRAHSVWIPDRYLPGREATVFWGALDLRWKNSHPTGIFITTKMTKTSITIKFWGTKQFDDIKTIYGPKRNVSSPVTIRNSDPDCHAQGGVIGFRITTYRIFYIDGVEVKREPFNTSYRASPNVLCVSDPAPTPTRTKTKTPTASPSATSETTPPA